METNSKRRNITKDEIVNAITHGIGVIFAIVALILLMIKSINYKNPWYIVSFIVYGVTMINLYTESTIYHCITNDKLKAIYKKIDHSSIFIFIAGSYTPFMLTALRDHNGILLLVLIWTCAVIGVACKFIFPTKKNILSTVLYNVMGWVIIFQIKNLAQSLPLEGVILLVVGGVLYSLGAVIYSFKKIPYNHGIWHLFVLAGTVCQFLTVIFYL